MVVKQPKKLMYQGRRLIRVNLNPGCRVNYMAWNWTTEDWDIPLTHQEALEAMTTGGANIEMACGDPREAADPNGIPKYTHWESTVQYRMHAI